LCFRNNDGKVKRAFKRLEEARRHYSSGNSRQRQATENEIATRLLQEKSTMSAVSTALSALTNSNSNSEDANEVIGKALGHVRFMYYEFVEHFHREPRDLEDLVNGVIYCELVLHFKY
jgi:hypothetical protein